MGCCATTAARGNSSTSLPSPAASRPSAPTATSTSATGTDEVLRYDRHGGIRRRSSRLAAAGWTTPFPDLHPGGGARTRHARAARPGPARSRPDEAQSELSVTLDAAESPATRRAFCLCENARIIASPERARNLPRRMPLALLRVADSIHAIGPLASGRNPATVEKCTAGGATGMRLTQAVSSADGVTRRAVSYN